MATLTGLIPVTVGTFEAYPGGGGGGGYHWGGGGGAGNAERRTIYIYISSGFHVIFNSLHLVSITRESNQCVTKLYRS